MLRELEEGGDGDFAVLGVACRSSGNRREQGNAEGIGESKGAVQPGDLRLLDGTSDSQASLAVVMEREMAIGDELSDTRLAPWLGFTMASSFTVFGPGQFFWESIFYWRHGWPPLGPTVFDVMVVGAGVGW